jgi:hypothetical protein
MLLDDAISLPAEAAAAPAAELSSPFCLRAYDGMSFDSSAGLLDSSVGQAIANYYKHTAGKNIPYNIWK